MRRGPGTVQPIPRRYTQNQVEVHTERYVRMKLRLGLNQVEVHTERYVRMKLRFGWSNRGWGDRRRNWVCFLGRLGREGPRTVVGQAIGPPDSLGTGRRYLDGGGGEPMGLAL